MKGRGREERGGEGKEGEERRGEEKGESGDKKECTRKCTTV